MASKLLAAAMAVAAAGAIGGCGSASVVAVTESSAGAYEPSLAAFRDGLAVAWYDTRDGHGEIYQRALDADATLAGPEIRLTTGVNDAYEADIQPAEGIAGGDGLLVGWYEKVGSGHLVPRLGLWSRNGAARWIRTLASAGRNVVVRVRGETVFAAWVQDEASPRAGVWAGWWNVSGEPIVAPRRLADAGKTTYNLNAAFGPEQAHGMPEALVVFDATAGTKAEELFLVEDDGAVARVTRLTRDDGLASKYPDLAVSGTRAALTWFDARNGNDEVYLTVRPLASLSQPDGLVGTRVTTSPGHSIGAYAAWNGDRLGLAWCDDTPGQHEIYFQDYDATGAPLAAARRLTETPTASLIPTIRPWRAGFALVWNEYQGASGHDEEGRSQVVVRLVP